MTRYKSSTPVTVQAPAPDPSAEQRSTSWLLALGLAFVFGYAAVSAFVSPATYRAYLPSFLPLPSQSTTDMLLRLFALYETGLAIGVLTRRFRHCAALLAAATLAAIVAVNGDAFEVLFRNVAIALAALALAQLSPSRHKVVSPGDVVRARASVATGQLVDAVAQ